MKPQPAEDLAESTPSLMPRQSWQLERNAGMAALFVGLSWRDFGGRLHFWRTELGGRVGRERGSSEEQLRGCKGDLAGLSCSEPSAHATVAPVESDTGGAASLASACLAE